MYGNISPNDNNMGNGGSIRLAFTLYVGSLCRALNLVS
jgi:hypothetical protein